MKAQEKLIVYRRYNDRFNTLAKLMKLVKYSSAIEYSLARLYVL